MKKVLMYCHEFYPINSGYSNAFINFARSITVHNGFHVTICTPTELGEQKELVEHNIDVVRLDKKINIPKLRYFINPVFFAKQVEELMSSTGSDILIVETFDDYVFLSSLSKDIYDKTIVRIHSTSDTEYAFFYPGLNYFFRRFTIKNFISKKVKWVASTNSYHIDFAKKYYFQDNLCKIADKGFFVLPNTIPNPKKIDNEQINIDKNKIKLFMLGRMNPEGYNQKGFFDFASALMAMNPELLGKLDITIVGDGPMYNIVEKMMSKLTSEVNFIKKLPHQDIMQMLKDSDVAILPSRYEGLSMFALEALYNKCLCLFSNVGGLSDMVIDGYNGFLFEPQAIEELTLKLESISKMGSDEIETMKNNSLNVFEERFSDNVVSSKFNALYKLLKTVND